MTVKLTGTKFKVKATYKGCSFEYTSNAGDWLIDDLEVVKEGEFTSVCSRALYDKLLQKVHIDDIRNGMEITFVKL